MEGILNISSESLNECKYQPVNTTALLVYHLY